MIIISDSFFPSPWSSKQPQFTWVEGVGIVMQSSSFRNPFINRHNHALEQGSAILRMVDSRTLRTKITVTLLALLIARATPAKGECGINKPFKICVQKSYHAEKVTVPTARCKTRERPCAVSGTIFMVSTKKVSYAILLLDGIEGKLAVGESYSAFLLCQKNPMMIPENNDGKPIAAFYVLE